MEIAVKLVVWAVIVGLVVGVYVSAHRVGWYDRSIEQLRAKMRALEWLRAQPDLDPRDRMAALTLLQTIDSETPREPPPLRDVLRPGHAERDDA